MLVTAPRDWKALRAALRARSAPDLGMQVERRPGHRRQPAAPEGRSHVTVLGTPLRPAAVAAIAGRIADTGANIDRIERMARYPVTAIELHVSGADPDRLRLTLAAEAAAQSRGRRRPAGRTCCGTAMRLVVMDVDSTLVQGEVIEMLAAHAGCRDRGRARSPRRRCAASSTSRQSLRERVALLAGLDAVGARPRCTTTIELAPGARTLVRTLKRLGYRFAIVSGGFTQVTDRIAADLGIDFAAANELEVVDGRLTGRIVGPVVDRAGKAEALRRFAAAGRRAAGGDGRDRRRRQRPRHARRRRARHRVQRQAGGAARPPTRRSTCRTSTRSCTCSASAARRSRPPTPEAGSTTPATPVVRPVDRGQPRRRRSRRHGRSRRQLGPRGLDLEHGERAGG